MQRTYQLSEISAARATPPIAARLRATGTMRSFASGVTIQQQGDWREGMWLIEAGQVILCRHGRSGEVTVFAVLGPGELFGELAYFTRMPRQMDAVADGESRLCWIRGDAIETLIDTDSQLARWLLTSLSNQLRTAIDRIEIGNILSAEARLARLLSDMTVRDGPDIVATHQQLANIIGVSRVTIGQTLAAFVAEGLIEQHYGRVRVLRADALAVRGA